MTDYGGKMFTPDAWMPKKKKEVKMAGIKAIEDMNMAMFGIGPDAQDFLKKRAETLWYKIAKKT